MSFKIIRKNIEPINEIIIPHIVNNITVLEKYDGREISSVTGCIAKDLYCSRICVFTGNTLNPILYINDYVLK